MCFVFVKIFWKYLIGRDVGKGTPANSQRNLKLGTKHLVIEAMMIKQDLKFKKFQSVSTLDIAWELFKRFE